MELVSAITAACETVTIVATSREPLGVDGERVVRIPSLEQRSRRRAVLRPGQRRRRLVHPVTDDDATIATICDRLDGIPLAIELAAARIRSLTPAELLQRLDDRFRLLRGSGRGGLERHQTLRATVTWSYQLLSPTASVVVRPAVGVRRRVHPRRRRTRLRRRQPSTPTTSSTCSPNSSTSRWSSPNGQGPTTRYRLLETLRQYGEERLDERGETATIRDRHLAHYRDIAYGHRPTVVEPRPTRRRCHLRPRMGQLPSRPPMGHLHRRVPTSRRHHPGS